MSSPPFGAKSTSEEVASHYSSQLKSKVILTTGVSLGSLGAQFVEAVAAQQPQLLILAGRDTAKLDKTANRIKELHPNILTRNLVLDLNDQDQIRIAAKEVLAYSENIDILVNNASVMACPYMTTADGLELQFGSGHIGHFLFTNQILSKILAVKGRIVNVTSNGHRLGPVRFDDPGFSNGQEYEKWAAYGQAKSANMLFSVGLAQRYGSQGLASFSLHPGVIMTTGLAQYVDQSDWDKLAALDRELGFDAAKGFIVKTASQGAATHVYCAAAPELEESNGAYCLDCAVAEMEEIWNNATDPEWAERLWKLSNEIVGENF